MSWVTGMKKRTRSEMPQHQTLDHAADGLGPFLSFAEMFNHFSTDFVVANKSVAAFFGNLPGIGFAYVVQNRRHFSHCQPRYRMAKLRP